jgi:hypothetical protein
MGNIWTPNGLQFLNEGKKLNHKGDQSNNLKAEWNARE